MLALALGAVGGLIGLAAALCLHARSHAARFNSVIAGAFGAWLGSLFPFAPSARLLAAGIVAALFALAINRLRHT